MKSKFLDTSEVQAIREHIDAAAWLPLWLALETGLRIGDVVKIRVRSVQADGVHYRAEKTNKPGVAKISAQLRKQLPKKGRWVFPSPRDPGKHITRQAVWHRIKKAAERAGIDTTGISPHSLRKVFAVELFREKGFKATQEALQHSNSLTTDIYAYADWNTGENAEKPLTRRDLELVVRMVIDALGDSFQMKRESKPRGKKSERRAVLGEAEREGDQGEVEHAEKRR